MLARVDPVWAIGEQDARSMAVAFCNWRRHSTSRMDPATRDLLAFLGVCVAIEGPRAIATVSRRSQAKARAKQEAQARANAPGGTVVGVDFGRQGG